MVCNDNSIWGALYLQHQRVTFGYILLRCHVEEGETNTQAVERVVGVSLEGLNVLACRRVGQCVRQKENLSTNNSSPHTNWCLLGEVWTTIRKLLKNSWTEVNLLRNYITETVDIYTYWIVFKFNQGNVELYSCLWRHKTGIFVLSKVYEI